MAPLRRAQRGRRRAEQAVDCSTPQNVLPSPPCPPADWNSSCLIRIYRAMCGVVTLLTFESVFKLSRRTFNYICTLVQDEMRTKPTMYVDLDGNVLSVDDRVAIALRRLSSGDSLATVGSLLGVTASIVSNVTWWFVEAMENKSRYHHLSWPRTEEKMNAIKSKFEEIYGLPNCCGVIDTTNIRFCQNSTSNDPRSCVWLDRRNRASMVLLVVVGPDMRFLKMFSGLPGNMSDYRQLLSSNLFEHCQRGEWLNGKKRLLPADGKELREYIIGDDGFPLLPWLMTPYRGKLSAVQTNYNRRLHQTWMSSQVALTRLKQTWKILYGEMWRPDKHKLPRIIQVCCILHNILIDLNDGAWLQLGTTSNADHNPGYKQQQCRLAADTAPALRDSLALYLSGNSPPGMTSLAGSLSIQNPV